jgi:hypothetical protein
MEENMMTTTSASFVSFAFLTAAIIIVVVINPAYAIEGFSTYKDPTSLFTIQYPSDWKIVGQKVGNVTFTPQTPSDYSSSNARHVSSLTIAVTNENVSTLDQLINQERFELAHTPLVTARIINESKITLSGLPAHKIVTESILSSTTVQFNTVELFTLKNGKQYSVSYNLGQIDDLLIIQQMINSFKIQA